MLKMLKNLKVAEDNKKNENIKKRLQKYWEQFAKLNKIIQNDANWDSDLENDGWYIWSFEYISKQYHLCYSKLDRQIFLIFNQK